MILSPDDRLTERCAELIYAPSAARDRLLGRMHSGCNRDGIDVLNEAYRKVTELEALMKKIREAEHTPDTAKEAGIISGADRERIADMQEAIAKVVAVDEFAPDELARYYSGFTADKVGKVDVA